MNILYTITSYLFYPTMLDTSVSFTKGFFNTAKASLNGLRQAVDAVPVTLQLS